VTIEPGIYIPNVGGIRLEDTFVVADSGPLPLTTSTHIGRTDRRRADEPSDGAGGAASSRDAGPRVEWDEAQFSGKDVDMEKVDDHKRFLIGDRAPWQSVDNARDE